MKHKDRGKGRKKEEAEKEVEINIRQLVYNQDRSMYTFGVKEGLIIEYNRECMEI